MFDSFTNRNCRLCIIEDEVTIWGQVGTTSGITIGAKAVILGQTGLQNQLGGKSYFGTQLKNREKN
jgi:UDP-3-O-[3-hydroxymyristoyl] glucosamine N-acyltransferase